MVVRSGNYFAIIPKPNEKEIQLPNIYLDEGIKSKVAGIFGWIRSALVLGQIGSSIVVGQNQREISRQANYQYGIVFG